jgi:hypothetical protein
LDGSNKKIKTFGDAWEEWSNSAKESIDDTIKKAGPFGKLAIDSGNKWLYATASVAAFAKQMIPVTNALSGFFKEQSKLNAGFAKYEASVKSFGDASASSFKNFADNMNLTRKQASELTDTFTNIGVQGNIAFSQIESIAAGIKAQFGALDTSMLK